jgi:regulatory protein
MPTARSGGGPAYRGRRRSGGGGHDAPVPGSPADDTPDADPAAVASTIALRKLTVAPRTRAELADALARGGVPDDVTEITLDRLEELGLVDDEEFARQWARTRQAGRGLARRALAYELRQRGVEDEVVRNALDDPDLDDELEAARALVRRRSAGSGLGSGQGSGLGSGLGSRQGPRLGAGLGSEAEAARRGSDADRDRQIRRLLGLLARKGYSAGVAARAVREVLAELSANPDDVPPGLDD